MKLSDTLKQYAAKLRLEIAGRTFSMEHHAPPIEEIEWAAEIIDSLPEADDGSVISPNRWAVLSLDAFLEDDRDRHYVVKIDDIDTRSKIVWVTEYDAENDDEHSYTVEEDGDYYFASTHSTKEEAEAAAKRTEEAN